jgi:UDP-glucuronate decarboxylase
MNILVTGGAGFIGSHLCRRLISEGNSVICLDNLSSGSMKGIEDLLKHPSFTFVEKDVTEPFDFPVERIFHLACMASPVFYQKDPVHTTKTNVFGALHVLELARKHHARVLLTSTSEVYGDALVHPQKEEYWGNVNPCGIRSCYDEGKRVAETLFFDYHRQYGVDIRVVRIFNTYGPGMLADDGRVVSNFIVRALRKEDLVCYGDGLQTRSLCYVSDTLEALLRMMNTEDVTGPVNVGNPNEKTVLEIAKLILQKTGSDSGIVFGPKPQDDPKRRCPDISLARRVLSWQPEVSLDEGLARTIAYFAGQVS